MTSPILPQTPLTELDHIKKVAVAAYEDLDTEAIRRLKVEALPTVVANDAYGADLFELGQTTYHRQGPNEMSHIHTKQVTVLFWEAWKIARLPLTVKCPCTRIPAWRLFR